MGMEPRFLYDYSRELYLYWYNLTYFGIPCNQINCQNWIDKIKNKNFTEIGKLIGKDDAAIIYNKFNSQYIITSTANSNLYLIMKNSDYFTEVFNNSKYRNISVFKINVEKLNDNK